MHYHTATSTSNSNPVVLNYGGYNFKILFMKCVLRSTYDEFACIRPRW